ncbi:MAG: L-threonylcarbamoyladenylate synthase [Vigna little leaf phytoplasma]|nr:L-threonylcarbamoyladenylate synthase [Vigna little leaf phytoplasma]
MLKHKIIIFPTDTVYGIGTTLYDKESLLKIFQIKKRDLNKQIAVLCCSLEQTKEIAIFDSKVQKVASFFWPGPLTLIVPTTIKYYQKTKEKKVGIRIPNHPLALKILRIKGPMKTTSVNQSGYPSLNNPHQIFEQYQKLVDYIYVDNQSISKISSTVIDTTSTPWKVIREGSITLFQINSILK